uniref:SAM domain-containing protein n=1 Tax=Plectus sambesii TaxID=2011161 RepID=A0A914WJL1_9BILA
MTVSMDSGDQAIRRFLDGCIRGDVKTVEGSLRAGLLVDCHDDDDLTPLQAAAAAGRIEIVELLLEHGADTELCNQVGLTPFLHACYHGREEVVELLLQKGAKINTQTFMGASGLTLASLGGHTDLVRTLLTYGLSINPPAMPGSDLTPSPLMAAALNGHNDVCSLLSSRGADVNAEMAALSGLNALSLVVMCGEPSTAQTLLDGGADPNLPSLRGRTPYELAQKLSRAEMIDVLEPRTTVRQTQDSRRLNIGIMEAVRTGNTQRFREILSTQKEKADLVDPADGTTPLMYAAGLGRLDYVTALVTAGANFDRCDSIAGMTALMQAICFGKASVAKYLIAAGADVNIRSLEGFSAFDLAAAIEGTSSDLITLLADKSAQKERLSNGNRVRAQNPNSLVWMLRQSRTRKAWVRKLANRLARLNNGSSRNAIRQQNSQRATNTNYPKTHPFWDQENVFGGNDFGASVDDFFRTCDDILKASVGSNSSASSSARSKDSIGADTIASARQMATNALSHSAAVSPLTSPFRLFSPPTAQVAPSAPAVDRPSADVERVLPTVPRLDFSHLGNNPEPAEPVSAASIQLEDDTTSNFTCYSVAQKNALLMGNGAQQRLRSSRPLRAMVSLGGASSVGSAPLPMGSQLSLAADHPQARHRPKPLTSIAFHHNHLSILPAPQYNSLKRDRPRRGSRPHSYHHETGNINGGSQREQLVMSGLGTLPRRTVTMQLGGGDSRPHSYHDPISPDQPLTPTRKSFNQFTFAFPPASSQMHHKPKFLSSPMLYHGSPNHSMNTGSRLMSAHSATGYGPFGSADLPIILAEEELPLLLRQLQLEEYCGLFEEQEVDMETFLSLTDKDLRELGIVEAGARNDILAAVRNLNRRLASQSLTS